MITPLPAGLNPALLDLLYQWAEWVSVMGTARSPMGHLQDLAELGRLVQRSAKGDMRLPTWFGLGAAVERLDGIDQVMIAAMIALDNQPWLEGDEWRKILIASLHDSSRKPRPTDLVRYRRRWHRGTKAALYRLQAAARGLKMTDRSGRFV